MKIITTIIFIVFSFASRGSEANKFSNLFRDKDLSRQNIEHIKKVLNTDPKKHIKSLFKIIKDKSYPEQSRWLSTILVGKTLGKKSINYLSSYAGHEDVILRLASLKALLSLEAKERSDIFEKALFDKSLLVRKQALQAVRLLNLKNVSKSLIKMLVDEKNYYLEGRKRKRSPILKDVITTIGDLKYKKSYTILKRLRSKRSYEDLYPSLDYAIGKLKRDI